MEKEENNKVLKIIAGACLQHHDTCETSVNIEARRILESLKNQGYKIMSEDDIVQERLKERKRAVKIAYSFKDKHAEDFKLKTKAGNDLAFISNNIAEECRYIGNAISGQNALSLTLGTKDEEIIKREMKEESEEHN